MYSLTSYDLWKTTPPDDDGEAWEQYEEKYLAAATCLLGLTRLAPNLLEEESGGTAPRSATYRNYPNLGAAALEAIGYFKSSR